MWRTRHRNSNAPGETLGHLHTMLRRTPRSPQPYSKGEAFMLPCLGTQDQLPSSGRWGNGNPTTLVGLFCCPQCRARFYGQPLLRLPTCPTCEVGRLRHIGNWDLDTQPWWPLLREGQR